MATSTAITYEKRKGKYVFCKDGVYYSMTLAQVHEMASLSDEIFNDNLMAACDEVQKG